MDVIVQPSVPWMSLNDQIKGSGLFFPVDPGPSVSAPTLQIIPQSQIPEETGNFGNEGHLSSYAVPSNRIPASHS